MECQGRKPNAARALSGPGRFGLGLEAVDLLFVHGRRAEWMQMSDTTGSSRDPLRSVPRSLRNSHMLNSASCSEKRLPTRRSSFWKAVCLHWLGSGATKLGKSEEWSIGGGQCAHKRRIQQKSHPKGHDEKPAHRTASRKSKSSSSSSKEYLKDSNKKGY